MKKHLDFLQQQLATSGGDYLTGNTITAADIIMSYPLITAKDRLTDVGEWEKGTPEATYPQLWAYIDRLAKSPGYLAALEKVEEIEKRPEKL